MSRRRRSLVRPYMLYLTRFYAGRPLVGSQAVDVARRALDDWISRSTLERYQNEYAIRYGLRSRSRELSRGPRTCTSRRNPRRAELRLSDWYRARAAGQGER